MKTILNAGSKNDISRDARQDAQEEDLRSRQAKEVSLAFLQIIPHIVMKKIHRRSSFA